MTIRAGRSRRRAPLGAATIAVVVLALVVGAMGSAAGAAKPPSAQVDLTGVKIVPVPAGNGIPQRSATAADARQPLPSTYTESEYLLEGTASTYDGKATGPVTVATTGNDFATRILVRAPKQASDFSGTVWIEPLNTSGGGDLDAVWSSIAPLIAQRGDAWIGVTVRAGQVPLLQKFDAARYAGLNIGANSYAWDMLRDIGTLVKTNRSTSPLADLKVKHVDVAGYSQSGVDAATFASAFNDVTRLRNGAPVFDGYLIGGRGGFMTPLQSTNTIIPNFETSKPRALDVPILAFEAQANVEGFAVTVPTVLLQQSGIAGADKITTPTYTYTASGGAYVRRPDANTATDRFRLVEVAGAPHAASKTADCDGIISTFPTGSFFDATAAQLARWAEHGTAPASVPRIKLATADKVSVPATDQYGNALGGLRSPFVDVPLVRYYAHATGGPSCNNYGSQVPLPAATLKQLYGDPQGYMTKFTKSLDAAIKNGTLLSLDRQAILDQQQAEATAAFSAA
jgi:hypothetical protein